MAVGLVMRQNVGLAINGVGDIFNSELRLRHNIYPKFSGSGAIENNFSVKIPFRGSLSGSSSFGLSNRVFFYQVIGAALKGSGSFKDGLRLKTELNNIKFSGSGKMVDNRMALWLPIPHEMSGSGEMVLRRLGALNENVIELLGINLLPGETVTIDTDLLQVLIGSKEDVSSITTDSVFFELNPGENEITISTDSDGPLGVTTIWQNRWL